MEQFALLFGDLTTLQNTLTNFSKQIADGTIKQSPQESAQLEWKFAELFNETGQQAALFAQILLKSRLQKVQCN